MLPRRQFLRFVTWVCARLCPVRAQGAPSQPTPQGSPDMTNGSVSYGSWSSPITADVVTADSIALSEPRIDGDDIYWIEGRPPNGRGVIVRWSNGTRSDVT